VKLQAFRVQPLLCGIVKTKRRSLLIRIRAGALRKAGVETPVAKRENCETNSASNERVRKINGPKERVKRLMQANVQPYETSQEPNNKHRNIARSDSYERLNGGHASETKQFMFRLPAARCVYLRTTGGATGVVVRR